MLLFIVPFTMSVRAQSPWHARSNCVPPCMKISLADIHCHTLPIQSPAHPISSSMYRVSKTGTTPPYRFCRLYASFLVISPAISGRFSRSTSITTFSIHVESDSEPRIECWRCLFTVLGSPIPVVHTCSSGFQIESSVSWLEEMNLSW